MRWEIRRAIDEARERSAARALNPALLRAYRAALSERASRERESLVTAQAQEQKYLAAQIETQQQPPVRSEFLRASPPKLTVAEFCVARAYAQLAAVPNPRRELLKQIAHHVKRYEARQGGQS